MATCLDFFEISRRFGVAGFDEIYRKVLSEISSNRGGDDLGSSESTINRCEGLLVLSIS